MQPSTDGSESVDGIEFATLDRSDQTKVHDARSGSPHDQPSKHRGDGAHGDGSPYLKTKPSVGTHIRPVASRDTSHGRPSNHARDSKEDEPLRTREKGADRKPHQRFHWWLEVVACVVSVIAFFALFGTLRAYDGRPSPNWPNWISLNTIVAIYAIVLKAAMLLVVAQGLGQLKWLWFSGAQPKPLTDLVRYDDATRGPVGAILLLWRLRFTHLLSSVGALVMVLALALDPIAQQIIAYEECSVPILSDSATMPRTNWFVESGSLHTGTAGEESITSGVINAVNDGIYSPAAAPAADCTTGNCTWSHSYSSVAWCSACEDISKYLVFGNTTYIWAEVSYDENITTGALTTVITNITTWNLTTSVPDGGVSVNMTAAKPDWEYAAMGSSVNGSLTKVQVVPEAETYVANLDFVLGKDVDGPLNPATGLAFTECDSAAANESWYCRGYGASRCALYPCVKTFTASVEDDVLTETVTDVGDEWSVPSGEIVSYTLDTWCITADERTSLAKEGYKIMATERWLAYNASEVPYWPNLTDTFPDSMVRRGCVYILDGVFAASITAYFDTLLTGTIIGAALDVSDYVAPGDFEGPQSVQTIFNFGVVDFDSMQDTFANISTSLTNYMRQNGLTNYSTPATGVAYDTKTCIAIRWPWLAFPAVLVVATLAFFAILVVETWPIGLRPEIWKSSPLALVYHGLPHDSVGAYADSDTQTRTLKAMGRLAHGTKVTLDNPVDGAARFEVHE